MGTTRDLTLADGRALRVHDTGRGAALTVVWHHGTPQTGALLPPLVEAADARDIRVISYGRPGYGGSAVQPGRTVASAADDVRQLADALGVGRFATMGASGGGPHALACAALLPDRVSGVTCYASPAPYTEEFDWYAGMIDDGGPRAGREGREARLAHGEAAEFNEDQFLPVDWKALETTWASLGQDAGAAGGSAEAQADDDVAFTSPWGFEPAAVTAPVLLAQGGADRVIPASHAESLLRGLPNAELWLRPRDGHISILETVPVTLDWLLALR
ncbi:alpha/beta fold hydrolase [Amycolatopsis saalfeldensis]|uniref:Pimeloyl-ACP methyl ester carboxylesterase n=1 Tax=Amycolatopsis saalfeldensis TaxID=394193 RepID=A0A1H8VUM3_9PSEU|nr:alpha/beta hydrolase [Amycolatopsis saalfeldensis]SEP19065.1 Pimeloyl-ACP methyl ester carboxylesterase [Amycolatopsis saalfeldensis]